MNQKIYFICPDNKKSAGGVKQLYRQVDILNKNNFEAYILHSKKGFRSKWFKNNTLIRYNGLFEREIKYYNKYANKKSLKSFTKYISLKISSFFNKFNSTTINENDILVFPEIYGAKINSICKKNKKVIFNQNCYYSFNKFNISETINPYQNENTLATIVVSQDSKDYLSFAFPTLNLFRIRLGIDHSKFYYTEKKKQQIAFMPRKLEEDINQIISILKIRNNLKNWNFIPIDNKNEDEVSDILRESAIFLSLNYREGFGLPPAEAMACGCVVIGYKGRGGNEYFDTDFSFPIEDRDIISFVKKIEEVAKEYESNNYELISKSKKASSTILDRYSLENEEQDIISAWRSITSK